MGEGGSKIIDWKIIVMLVLAAVLAFQFFNTKDVDLSVYEDKIELLQNENTGLKKTNQSLLDSNLVLIGENTVLRAETVILKLQITDLAAEKDALQSDLNKLKDRYEGINNFVGGLSDDELLKLFTDYLRARRD